MGNDFTILPKECDKKKAKSVTLTIRIEPELKDQYDELAEKSGRSRNELIGRAMRYALEHLNLGKVDK